MNFSRAGNRARRGGQEAQLGAGATDRSSVPVNLERPHKETAPIDTAGGGVQLAIEPSLPMRNGEDIQKWRAQAEKEKRVPSEAWFLECVQLDRNNPKPCSEEDKKKYPNGQMVEQPSPDEVKAAGAEPSAPSGIDDDDLDSIIKGNGAPEAGAKPLGAESDDDILNAIKGMGAAEADAGAADASKPKSKAGRSPRTISWT